MEKYQYMPLPEGYSQIRLIRLHPGQPGDDLLIELLYVELSDKPQYEALSYTWGDSSHTNKVYVFESMLHDLEEVRQEPILSSIGIAKNLFHALQSLRYPQDTRTVWIDAICINQEDLDERSTEVLEMGSIYKNALTVIVWLGPQSHNSSLALDTLRLIGEAIVFDDQAWTIGGVEGTWPAMLEGDTAALISCADRWFAIKDILSREWFTRLWVFQEIMLAQEACVVIDGDVLKWPVFVLGLHWIRMMNDKLDRNIQALALAGMFNATIRWYMNFTARTAALSTLNALSMTQNMICYDPRDRLYSIRSLLFLRDGALIHPDYNLSIAEVYTNHAIEWISKLNDANFLEQCEIQQEPREVKITSWVPDWSQPRSATHLIYGNCSGRSAASSTVEGGTRLRIQGKLLRTLIRVTMPVLPQSTSEELLTSCRLWLHLASGSELLGESSGLDAFCEMIVGGCTAEKKDPRRYIYGTLAEVGEVLTNSLDDDRIHSHIRNAIVNRSFFTTDDRRFGLGP